MGKIKRKRHREGPLFSQDFLDSYDSNALIAEIQRVAHDLPDGPITIRQFHKHSRVSADTVKSTFGSWKDALIAAGLAHRYSGINVTSKMRSQPGHGWTREKVISDLQEVAKTLGTKGLTQAMFFKHGTISVDKVRSTFGSWNEALLASDLHPSKETCFVMRSRPGPGWTREKVISDLQEVAKTLGTKRLTQAMFFKHGTIGINKVRSTFGSWNEALLASDLHPSKKTCLVGNRSDAISLLRTTAASLNKTSMSMSEFEAVNGRCSSQRIAKLFGNWTEALSAADLRTAATPQRSREDCIENLRLLWLHLGRQPKYDDLYRQPSTCGPRAYEGIWGTFLNAVREFLSLEEPMSLDEPTGSITPKFQPTKRLLSQTATDDLIEELRRVAKSCGRSHISQGDIRTHSPIAVHTFIRRFGSWPKALTAADLQPSFRKYSEDDYFQNLMSVWEALEHRPSYTEIDSPPSVIGASSYAAKFGTWREAIRKFLTWLEQTDTPICSTNGPTLPSNNSPAEEVSTREQTDPPVCSTNGPTLPSDNSPTEERSTDGISRLDPTTGRDRRRLPTKSQRFRILTRDDFKCRICGRRASDGVILQADHIKPWARGGLTVDENLCVLCEPCNSGKTNSVISDLLKRVLVSS